MSKENLMTEPTRTLNRVRIVGTLDTQTISRRDAAQLPGVVTDTARGERPRATLTRRFNAVQGTEQRAVVQVPSPFGTPFQITLHLEGAGDGHDLLTSHLPGTLIAAEGELEWVQITDSRYATDPTQRGRRASELIVRTHAVHLADEHDEPGCDVWLEGTVLTTTRILRHPDRPVLIAVTTVRVTVEHTRRGSRARLSEPANVAVAIPVEHPDAPNLMRPGNQVVIEGMLERYIVPVRGVEVDRALAAIDEEWATEQAGLSSPQAQRDAERRYARRRRRLQETIRTRVVAGYVELQSGTPATLDEAQALRAEQQRARRADQQARRSRRTTHAAPETDASDTEDDGSTATPVRRRRRTLQAALDNDTRDTDDGSSDVDDGSTTIGQDPSEMESA
jgi:hypothetical protein